MHILLITSEELNETNEFSSCFEISQAKALQKRNIKVGIISVGAITIKNILRTILFRLQKKEVFEPRFAALNNWKLLKLAGLTFYRKTFKKYVTRRLNIQGIVVYEALISGMKDFFVNHHGYKSCIAHGLNAASKYINERGTPDIVHAHSRFLLANIMALELKRKFSIPYLVTEHSTFYLRQPPNEEQKVLINQTFEESVELITVSHKLGEIINKTLGKKFNYSKIPNIV